MDIVARLRTEGEDAMRKHLSLGMHALCTAAADEIERLRAEVQKYKDREMALVRLAHDPNAT